MRAKIIAAVVLIGLIALPLLAVSYFGYNAVGGTPIGSFSGYIVAAGPFTMPENGTATRVELYTNSIGSNCSLGIYADSSTNPGSLLGTTINGALNGGTGTDDWRGEDLTGSVSLTSGTVYWLGFQCSNSQNIFYDTNTGHGRYFAQSYSGSLNDPFPAGTTWDLDFSIRAVYTPSGGSSGIMPTTKLLLGVGGR